MRLRVLLSEPGAGYDGMAGRKLRDLGISSQGEQRFLARFQILPIHRCNKHWGIEYIHFNPCLENTLSETLHS